MYKSRLIAALTLLGCAFGLQSQLFAQGAIVNEFSNGSTGVQEYVELVVIGPAGNENCGPVDLRGFIFDDNNGDFSCGPASSTGIASGHIRFAPIARWQAMNPGDIIVIYNGADKNPAVGTDDVDDTVVPDGVYVLPSTDAGIEVTTTASGCNIPAASGSCPGSGNATYAAACYSAGGLWTRAGLRNGGDAAQTRDATGAFFHGIGYGGSGINGGPDNILLTGGGQTCFLFMNTTSDDYRLAANFMSDPVSNGRETPGTPNGGNNTIWINTLQTGPCTLPVEYQDELSGRPIAAGNLLTWKTHMEVNASTFRLQKRHSEATDFVTVTELEATGTSAQGAAYEYLDETAQTQTFYRLVQVDHDGSEYLSRTIEIMRDQQLAAQVSLYPNPVNRLLQYELDGIREGRIEVVDELGRIVLTTSFSTEDALYTGQLSTEALPDGMYFFNVRGKGQTLVRPLMVTH